MFDRENRSATPLIEGRRGQQPVRRQIEGVGRIAEDDASDAFISQVDLYAIIHDLKNRIAVIKGWTEVVQRQADVGTDPAAVGKGLARILTSVNVMDERLNEVMDIGESCQHEPDGTDLWVLAERMVDQYRGITQSHTLTLVGPGSGRVIGHWNTRSIERILANLLSNAIKYSPCGGHIRVDVELLNTEAHLTVYDHGIGIPDAALPHIFDPFYRGGNVHVAPDAPHIPGHGIGLFAARTLAYQLDGHIEVISSERQGSIFTLVLPIDPASSTRCARLSSTTTDQNTEGWDTMQDGNIGDSLPTHDDRDPETVATPSTKPQRSNTDRDLDVDDIDIVDLQSMQSFPASDPPVWPTPAPRMR